MSDKDTIKQQIKNIQYALAMVDSIPKRLWAPALAEWSVKCEDPKQLRKRSWERSEECEKPSAAELRAHTCGTAACFGGWVAVMPYFKRQGIKRGALGEPYVGEPEDPSDPSWRHVGAAATQLFGEDGLFDVVDTDVDGADAHDIGERRVVKRRLKKALAARQAELAGYE